MLEDDTFQVNHFFDIAFQCEDEPIRNKIYYEENKEKHKQKVKEYKEKINYNSTLAPEKKKEYARQAYQNKKAKMKKVNENEDV